MHKTVQITTHVNCSLKYFHFIDRCGKLLCSSPCWSLKSYQYWRCPNSCPPWQDHLKNRDGEKACSCHVHFNNAALQNRLILRIAVKDGNPRSETPRCTLCSLKLITWKAYVLLRLKALHSLNNTVSQSHADDVGANEWKIAMTSEEHNRILNICWDNQNCFLHCFPYTHSWFYTWFCCFSRFNPILLWGPQ